ELAGALVGMALEADAVAVGGPDRLEEGQQPRALRWRDGAAVRREIDRVPVFGALHLELLGRARLDPAEVVLGGKAVGRAGAKAQTEQRQPDERARRLPQAVARML